MKKILLAVIFLLAAGAAIVHYFPAEVEPFIEGTPLGKLVATSTPVYQWRDENGTLQVTGEPPPNEIPYEIKQYALDANLVPSHKQESD